MPSVSDILGRYAPNANSQANASSSDSLYDAAAATFDGSGEAIEDPVQRDLMSLDTFQLFEKYGPVEATRMLSQFSRAKQGYSSDTNSVRAGRDVFGDTATAIGRGAVNTLGGAAALGAGVFSDRAGAAISGGLQDFSDWTREELESPGLTNRKRAFAARERMDAQDNEAQYQRDLETDGGLVAGLKRFGRDALDTFDNAWQDGAILGDVVAEGTGSLVGGVPLVRGASAVGAGVKSLLQTGKLAKRASVAAKSGAASGAVGIAGMEAGGAYTQTVNEVMGMSHEELMESSPDYVELIAQGMSSEDAKLDVAGNAGLIAASVTAPAAVAAGRLVSRFEANPWGAASFRKAFQNTGTETFEEAAQGVSSQAAGNFAISRTADTDRDITDGLGSQATLGAIGGFGAGAVVQAPGATAGAVKSAASGVKEGSKKLWQKALDYEANLVQDTEDNGTVGANTIREKITATKDFLQKSGSALAESIETLNAELSLDKSESPEGETAPVEFDPEEFQRLGSSVFFAPDTFAEAPDFIREGIGEADNTLDAIQGLTRKLNSLEDGSREQLTTARYLQLMKEEGENILASPTIQQAKQLPEDNEARQFVERMEDILNSVSENPGVKRAVARVKQVMAAAVEKGNVTPVSEAEVNTPEGKAKIDDAMAVAETTPAKSSYEANEAILNHAGSGKITLTPAQKAALTTANAIIEAERAATESVKNQGLTTNVDLVSGDVISSRDTVSKTPHKSLATYAREITRAYKLGEIEAAQTSMALLKNFAEGMNNKVAGLNQHFAQGGGKKETGIEFDTAIPGKVAKIKSNQLAYVDLGSASSVRFAQTVGKEAEILGSTYNKLVDIFPELEAEKMDLTELDPAMQLPAEQVVQNVRNGVQAQPQAETSTPEPKKTEQKSEPKQEPKTEKPVEEVKPEPEPVVEPDLTKAELAGRYDARTNNRGKAPDTFTPAEVKAYNAARKDEVAKIKAEQEAAAPAPEPEAAPEPEPKAEEKVEEKTEEVVSEPEPEVAEAPEPEVVEEPELTDEELALGREDATPEETELTLGDYFSRLIGIDPKSKIKNLFLRTFRLRKEQGSRLRGVPSPLAFARDAFNSQGDFERVTSNRDGAKLLTPEVSQSYSELLEVGGSIVEELNKKLNHHLRKEQSEKTKDKRSNLQKLVEDGILNSYENGRVLNLIERVGGKIALNPALAEGAVLASLQWLMDSRHRGAVNDRSDVFDLIGAKEHEAPISPSDLDTIFEVMRNGQTRVGAVRSLANHIRRYWDVQTADDAYIGLAEGIPEAMAKEILAVMDEQGMITETRPVTDTLGKGVTVAPEKSKDGAGLGLSDPAIVTIGAALTDKDINLYILAPQAIEQLVALRPQTNGWSVGAPPKEVARTQLNNRKAKLTDEQRKAVRSRQNNPHTLNLRNLKLARLLGSEGVQFLYGGGPYDKDLVNKVHEKSMKGRDTTARLAYEGVMALEAEIRGYVAGNPQVSMKSVPVHFPYTFNKSNRLQIIGTNNPQASKLMREIVLPTASTLDLTTDDHFTAFMVAIGQHIGVKVEKVSHAQAIKDAEKKLATILAPAVDMASQFLADESKLPEGFIETMREAFNGSPEPAAIHSLIEYARYLNSVGDTNALSKFETQLYLEADGVTNGPINALALFSGGSFTPKWVANMARGGLSFGDKAKSLHEIKAEISSDLYQEGATNWANILSDKGLPHEHAKHVMRLLSTVLGDALTITQDGEGNAVLEIDRGLTKNPLTVTLYGAGANGLASKLTGEVVTAISERMTEALKRMADGASEADAMFPNDPDAEAKFTKFKEDITALTQTTLVKKKGKVFPVVNKKAYPVNFDPKNFELAYGNYASLKDNIKIGIVPQLQEAIAETVGPELMGTLGDIRIATQLMALGKKHAWFDGRDAKLAEQKEAAGEDYANVKANFLKKSDLAEIDREADKVHAPISTGRQNYVIENTEKAEGASTKFSTTMDNKWATPGFVEAPSNPGVKGIPTMVIGSADGMMMQIYAAIFGADRTGDVFDGMNLPLDTLKEMSRNVNESVAMAWQENPLQAVADAFSSFAEQFNVGGKSSEQIDEMLDAVFGKERVEGDNLVTAVQQLADMLQRRAAYVQARQNVMSRVKYSVDQMASADAPYFHEGKITLTGTPDEISIELNKMLHEELNDILEKRGLLEKPTVVPELVENTSEDASGVRVREARDLKKLGNVLKGNKDQQQILEHMAEMLADRDWKIITGSKDQVRGYLLSQGQSTNALEQPGINGFVLPGSKTLVLLNPTRETLTHEVIHAATYAVLENHYSGQEVSKDTQIAIRKLEALMDQFLQLDMTNEGGATVTAYQDAVAEITKQQDQGNRAAALNEFMAWGLTNQHLARKLKATKASGLGAFVKNFIEQAKRLIFGRRANLKVADDMFSNLRFGNVIVANAGQSVRDYVGESALFHRTSSTNSEKMDRINEALRHRVISHFRNEYQTASKGKLEPGMFDEQVARRLQAMTASNKVIARSMEVGFQMSPDEANTFTMLVNVMGSTTELDPNAMSKAADMYAHIAETLTIEDFMEDPDNGPDSDDWYRARGKYDLVIGKDVVGRDGSNRSTLVPVFVALSMVSPEMQRVLSRMDAPVRENQKVTGIDTWLENFGLNAMDSLGRKVSGVDKNSATVGAVMNNLTEQLIRSAEESNSRLDLVSNKTSEVVDTLNDKVATAMQQGASKLFDKADQVLKDYDNKVVQQAAKVVKAFAAIADRDKGNQLAEDAIGELNRSSMPDFIQRLMSDFVGRTENNAPIYDLIKRVHSWVSQTRQQFREELPKIIRKKFARELSDQEWSDLMKGMGRTDLAALRRSMSEADILRLVTSQSAIDQKISDLESSASAMAGKQWPLIQRKALQLANYMNTGQQGSNLLRNAEAVTRLLGERVPSTWQGSPELSAEIDQLITLYAVNTLDQRAKDTLASLASESEGGEFEGMRFTLNLLNQLRKDEGDRSWGNAGLNYYKGHVPTKQTASASVIVRPDSEQADLEFRGYTRVGDYAGSDSDRSSTKRGYYVSDTSAKATYRQGIMQTVQQTAGGVELHTGFTVGPETAGVIADEHSVRKAWRNRHNETATEHLLPVWDANGEIFAYERSVAVEQLAPLKREENLAEAMGVWRGRQFEEAQGRQWNQTLIKRLGDMQRKDFAEGKQDQYVDLFATKDKVWRDALNTIPGDTLAMVQAEFGEHFWVRRDMIDDAVGYRDASIRNAWDGQTRLDPRIGKVVRTLAINAFGKDGYSKLVNAESIIQNAATDLRVMIVVKSIIVPAANLTWNIVQLASRGVPLLDVARSFPRKTDEINTYLRVRTEKMELEAELAGVGSNLRRERQLKAEIQKVNDQIRRLSIYPLIEAGEFTSISDGLLSKDDLALSEGRIGEYIENAVDKLPKSAQTLAKYGIVGRDTALFKALQRTVEYGDFLAKATLYDHLTKKKGKTQEEALAAITEEFVNYDRLPGRVRGYLEQMGLLWFWNFKIRSTKVAVSMVRNNPVHALFAMNLPVPTDLLGPVGSPLTDNAVDVLLDARADYSIGPGMAFRAPDLLPVMQLM